MEIAIIIVIFIILSGFIYLGYKGNRKKNSNPNNPDK